MLPHPLITSISPASGNEGKGGDGSIVSKYSEDLSEKINLDLGIGGCACVPGKLKENEKLEQEKEEFLLTSAQFHEFHNQILVFNLIAFGFPVPFHLFVPIWMSVKGLYGPAIYKKYPSFTGFNLQNSDYSNMMDLEPGRCRRTDGRKWRCSKNVVPNQKYCERHMHRGRQGSRKHVEPSEHVLKPDNKTSTSDDSRMPTTSLVTPDIDGGISIPVQSGILDHDIPRLNHTKDVVTTVKWRSDKNCHALSTIDACCRNIEYNSNINIDVNCASGSTWANSLYNGTMDVSYHTESTGTSFRKINSRKRTAYKNNNLGFISPGFGLSPKSVLQCGAAAGKISLDLGSKNATKTELQRCRRTDGKKWQCSRDAIPGQKYCVVHLHRGAKRLRPNPDLVTLTSTTPAHRGLMSHSIPKSLDSRINLNTMPASPQQTSVNNSTSSTSDATTITDENLSDRFTESILNC